ILAGLPLVVLDLLDGPLGTLDPPLQPVHLLPVVLHRLPRARSCFIPLHGVFLYLLPRRRQTQLVGVSVHPVPSLPRQTQPPHLPTTLPRFLLHEAPWQQIVLQPVEHLPILLKLRRPSKVESPYSIFTL